LSSQLPRRHAAAIPSNVPAAKLMIVARPTRPTVHGRALRITLVTVDGYELNEMPRLPRLSCHQ